MSGAGANAAMSVATLLAGNGILGTTDNRIRTVPKTASSGFVAEGGRYALHNDAWSPMAQMVVSVGAGVPVRRAAIIAGFRSGMQSASAMLGWLARGNSVRAVLTNFAEHGPQAVPGTEAEFTAIDAERRRGLVWLDAASAPVVAAQARYAAVYPEHRADRIPFDDLLVEGAVKLDIRSDELQRVDDGQVLTQALVDDITSPNTLGIIRHVGESAVSFAILVAYHLQRADGHTWFSGPTNPVAPAFRSFVQATKIGEGAGITGEDVNAMMHDAFHPYANLTSVIHTLMGFAGTQEVYSMAADYRYPFTPKGAAVVTSGAALGEQIRESLRLRNLTAETGVLGTPAEADVLKAIRSFAMAKAGLAADPTRFAPSRAAGADAGALRLAAARKLAAYLVGVADGLGLRDGPVTAPALQAAARQHTAMATAGRMRGQDLARTTASYRPTSAQLGLKDLMTTIQA